MSITFPNPATQVPVNTFSPTSTPFANTVNEFTYVYNTAKGVWVSSGTANTEVFGDSLKNVVNLRMSLSSTSPVPSTNQSGSTLYVHPYNGNEIALYDDSGTNPRWYLLDFPSIPIPSFSISSLPAETLHDVYAYNSGDISLPELDLEFLAWADDDTPPSRSFKDGIPCKNGDVTKRFIGLLRTTGAGTSTVDLGGSFSGFNDPPTSIDETANFPRVFLSNYYNQYDTRIVYFFGTSGAPDSGWWNYPETNSWSVVPGPLKRRLALGGPDGTWENCFATPPQIQFVQAAETLVIVFMDIYNNALLIGTRPSPAIVYVAPGIDAITPPTDAFFGEDFSPNGNTTAGSQWARSLPPKLHKIYYLFKQLGSLGECSKINEHPSHGMIVIIKS